MPDRIFTFTHKNKDHKIVTKGHGDTIPTICNASNAKEIKSVISNHMIFVKDMKKDVDLEFNLEEQEQFKFLDEY